MIIAGHMVSLDCAFSHLTPPPHSFGCLSPPDTPQTFPAQRNTLFNPSIMIRMAATERGMSREEEAQGST